MVDITRRWHIAFPRCSCCPLTFNSCCSPAILERIFAAGNTFSNRLGKESGLRHLGMFEQGVICNNDTEKWQRFRRYFAKGRRSRSRSKACKYNTCISTSHFADRLTDTPYLTCLYGKPTSPITFVCSCPRRSHPAQKITGKCRQLPCSF